MEWKCGWKDGFYFLCVRDFVFLGAGGKGTFGSQVLVYTYIYHTTKSVFHLIELNRRVSAENLALALAVG